MDTARCCLEIASLPICKEPLTPISHMQYILASRPLLNRDPQGGSRTLDNVATVACGVAAQMTGSPRIGMASEAERD